MPGRINLRKLESPQQFQRLCERLLARLYPDFHPVSQAGGDEGVDGFLAWGSEFFQFTHTEGNVPLRKVRADLEKAKEFRGVNKWHFLCSRSLSAQTWRFIETERTSCSFAIEIWDGTRIEEELSKQQDLVDEFFPEYAKKAYEGTEKIQRILKRKRLRARDGDAPEGLEINEDEKEDIQKLINQLAEEEAVRRGRKANYQREWAELNSKFDVSSYHRLPKNRFGQAIEYLRGKLFKRRAGEPRYFQVQRAVRGIHGIAKALAWTEQQRRQFYSEQTGKDHLKDMNTKEKLTVYEAMKLLQKRIDAQG